ncbi:restriction endonuclease subunit S [Bacteroides gallinaceum]|uniref:restriction endonuclease subunit S n=1 Tax=Bacteroides gallinaceum TaxID=1462571 RepID=UPI0025A49B18|nr:restriction endonuclease subunit S [Bacteroides gallinaceum]MDM8209043.1 restriction endonuclease subunit S [Bacteroides gallinaceum]
MERYESYKDSGVAWIGQVPSHWKIYRFKDFLTLKNVVSSNENKIGLENIEGGTGRFIETNTDFDGNGIEFDVGDIVYGKLRPYLQKVWVATFKGNAVGDFYVFRTKAICDRQYVFYVMLSEGFTAICNGATFGAKMPRVSSDFIRCLHFYLPPFVEQQAIAAYLDKRCSEIDKSIATQQKRITLLQELKQSIITQTVTKGIHPDVPLKDSGVEWIGKVPEHWEVMKTSLLYTNIGSGTTPSTSKQEYYEDDGFCWLQTGDLNDGYITDTSKKISKVAVKDYKLRFYPVGSIVIAMYGATIGKIGLLKISTSTNQACCVLPYSNKMNEMYAFYVCQIAKKQMLLEAVGGGQPNISQDIIKKLKLPVPPLCEQQAIAVYLDKRCSEIDKAIATQQKRISLLQELKQSVITEAITGKIKVC